MFSPQNKYYQSLRHKKPLRCENYAEGVRTTIVSLRHENYTSRFRGIQACKRFFIRLTPDVKNADFRCPVIEASCPDTVCPDTECPDIKSSILYASKCGHIFVRILKQFGYRVVESLFSLLWKPDILNCTWLIDIYTHAACPCCQTVNVLIDSCFYADKGKQLGSAIYSWSTLYILDLYGKARGRFFQNEIEKKGSYKLWGASRD